MSRLRLSWCLPFALSAAACAAAIPSVDDLQLSGAVRFVVDEGEAVSAGPEGLPLLVARPGEICVGDPVGGVPAGDKAVPVGALPIAQLSLDCVDFVPGVFFPRWTDSPLRVAFMGVSAGAESDIWVYDPAAGAVTNVSGDAGEDTMPVWVDDERIAFVRTLEVDGNPVTSWQLVEAGGGVPTSLAIVDGSVELSPGTRVVQGTQPRIIFNLVGSDGTYRGIHEVVVGGSGMRLLHEPQEEDRVEGWRLIDVHPKGTAALVVTGRQGEGGADVEVRLVDLVDGGEREVKPLFGDAIGDARFSSDGLRLLVWELGTGDGDALVVRSAGSDADGETLVVGELGQLGIFANGGTIDIGRDLVLVTIEP